MTSFPVHCNCTEKKIVDIDEKIIENISDYADMMETYFFKKKFSEKTLFHHFKQFPLPRLPIDPFIMNYLVFGVDSDYFYSPFVLSKLCEVLNVKISPKKFFGENFLEFFQGNDNPYLLLKKNSDLNDYASLEEKLVNFYDIENENDNDSSDIVSIHKVFTDEDSKVLVIYRGSEHLKHKTAQLLQKLNLIFFTYEFKLIQQFRGKEKSKAELENLQKKVIFTDWGQIYPYVFPQNNYSILEDQGKLRKKKFNSN